MWSEWKDHVQGPPPVSGSTLVIIKMCTGHVFPPVPADAIPPCCWDWPEDAIVQYKVKQLLAMADLKRIASLTKEQVT
jgi:hypothetical protein